MKIKILQEDSVYKLQQKLNEALDMLNDDDVIDIKYQGIGNTPAYSTNWPSAMLILTDDGYKKIKYRF